jgi:hypothetical protein
MEEKDAERAIIEGRAGTNTSGASGLYPIEACGLIVL